MSVKIEPYNQERKKVQGKTTLYYTNVAYDAAHKGLPPKLAIKGQMLVKMPPLGESLILDDVYAKDVEFKTQYQGKSAFTRAEAGGEAMAKYIKEARAKGISLDPATLEKMKTEKILMEVPDDDLVAALQQRYPDAPPELLEMLKKDKKAKPEKSEETKTLDPSAAAGLVTAAKKEK